MNSDKLIDRAVIIGVLCENEADFRGACSQLTWGDHVRVIKLYDSESIMSCELDLLLTTKSFWVTSRARNLYDLARAHVRNRV